MAEYINREEMLKFIRETNANYHWLTSQYSASWIYDFIESQPTADVVPKSEVEWLYKQVDMLSQEVMYNDDIAKMKVDEAKEKVAREIFEEIEKIIQDRKNEEIKRQGDNKMISPFTYSFGALEVIEFQFAELKKKYIE